MAPGAHLQIYVWRWQFQISKERGRELIVVVLSGMHQKMVDAWKSAKLVCQGHNLHKVRSRAHDTDNSHWGLTSWLATSRARVNNCSISATLKSQDSPAICSDRWRDGPTASSLSNLATSRIYS